MLAIGNGDYSNITVNQTAGSTLFMQADSTLEYSMENFTFGFMTGES